MALLANIRRTCDHLAFTGGEPTHHPDFADFLRLREPDPHKLRREGLRLHGPEPTCGNSGKFEGLELR